MRGNKDFEDMSDADLVDLLKVHFHLMADVFSTLAGRDEENNLARMGEIQNGFKVDCVVTARPAD